MLYVIVLVCIAIVIVAPIVSVAMRGLNHLGQDADFRARQLVGLLPDWELEVHLHCAVGRRRGLPVRCTVALDGKRRSTQIELGVTLAVDRLATSGHLRSALEQHPGLAISGHPTRVTVPGWLTPHETLDLIDAAVSGANEALHAEAGSPNRDPPPRELPGFVPRTQSFLEKPLPGLLVPVVVLAAALFFFRSC